MPRIAAALAAAFAGDPPMRHMLDDHPRREALLRPWFDVALRRLYLPAGETWVCDEPVGAAVWVAPGRWPFTVREQLPVVPVALRTFGRRPRRVLDGVREIERGHPRDPHWYLDFIGVAPGGQGSGAGSALLQARLERCDAEAQPAYLNAGSARSRDLYLRHGFEVVEEFRLPRGGPPLWRMWREPQRPPVSSAT